MDNVTLIGIDCATQPKKTGLALGVWDGTAVSVQKAIVGQNKQSIAETIHSWLPTSAPVLLAIDAPLGWPAPLGQALVHHQAGALLPPPANHLFRRETDRFVQQTFGKTPLDVGADRIARTAHTALGVLQELRDITEHNIPLAWEPTEANRIRAIEVYPAATLTVLLREQLPVPPYKGKNGANGRKYILNHLQDHLHLPEDRSLIEANDDVLDAVICLLCATDFLQGRTISPQNKELAQKEGWIWIRQRGEEHE